MIRPLCLLSFLLLLWVIPVPAAQKAVTALGLNLPIKRQLTSQEKHLYQISLKSGQYLNLTLTQEGIDVILDVYDPKGTKLMEGDSPVGRYGVEKLQWIANTAGDYRIEVYSTESEAIAGKYTIQLLELRSAKLEERVYFSRIEELKQLSIQRGLKMMTKIRSG